MASRYGRICEVMGEYHAIHQGKKRRTRDKFVKSHADAEKANYA
jgi:hypothetical protein